MSESYLSLKQVVDILDIPENSCKRYMIAHEEFVRFDKEHNRYRVHVSAVEVLKTIRNLYSEGHKRDAVNEYLKGSGIPVTITVDDSEDGGKSLININNEVAELKNMLQLLYQKAEEDKQVIIQKAEADKQELKEAFQKEFHSLKTLVNRKESEKVSELRLSMEESKRVVEEVSASVVVFKEELEMKLEEAVQKKGFFQKLFGR